MLIFEFGASPEAETFAAACRERGKDAWVWASQDAMHLAWEQAHPGADIFPFQLADGAVVTVDRDDDDDVERKFQRLVESFGGTYAGT